MTTTTEELPQSRSPIVTAKAMKQLVRRGLIGVPEQQPFFPNPLVLSGIEFFKGTVLAILLEVEKPINRMKLIRLALKRNCPPTSDPVEVYHVAIRQLRREGMLVIDKSKGWRVEYQLVSLSA